MSKNRNMIIDEHTPLLFLAGPMFLEMLLNILINNVDTLMLSHYSEIAVGDYMFPLYIGILTMWGLGVTVGYGMGVIMGLGVAGVFIGTATDEFVRGLIVMLRWKKQAWRGKSLVK